MAINLDRNLLEELGLGTLPDMEKTNLLNHIYETLEMRVGMRLADQMSNEQLDEFEKYFEAKDDAGAFHWLETNFPNYKDVVEEEFNKLKEEVRLSVPEILKASQQQAQQPLSSNAVPAPPVAAQPTQPAGYPPQPLDSLQTQSQPPQAQAFNQPAYPPQPPQAQAFNQPAYPPQPPLNQPPYQSPAGPSSPTSQPD